MIYRNPQEQLQYVTDEVEKIKQSLGSALPDPIPGPEGPAGATGPKGNPGDRGPGIVGYGTELPSTAQDGDMFILRTNVPGGAVDYVMYKWATYQWLPQFSMRGPAGPIGPEGGTEVIANPTGEVNDILESIKVDGVNYAVGGYYVRRMAAPASTTLTNAQKEQIIGGCFIEGDFLGYHNPIMMPVTQSGDYYYGVIFGPYNGTSWTVIEQYQINPDNSIVLRGNYGNIELKCLGSLNGKTFPTYPNSSGDGNKYDLIYGGDGELYWHTHGAVDSLSIGSSFNIYPSNALTIEVNGPSGASDLKFNDFNTVNLLTQGSGQVNIGVHDEGGDLYVYGDAEVDGGLYVGSSLRVENDITVDNDVDVAGDVAADTLHIDSQSQFNNDVEINGDCNVYGNIAAFDGNKNLTVKIDPQNAIIYSYTGFEQYDSTAQTYKKVNDLSQIVDSDGHKRFQSFGLTMNTIQGITWGYCDCVLNGHELKIVISGQIANGTTLSITDWGSVILPTWIYQVLQPVIPNSDYLSVDGFRGYYSDWNSVYMEIAPYKSSGNELDFYFIQTPSFSQDALFRYEQSFII